MKKSQHCFLSLLNNIRIRLHALLVLAIVGWAAYKAIMVLLVSVFFPTPIPARFLNVPLRLKASELYRPDVPGINAIAPRAPLNHFHGVDQWFQSDPHNGCTTRGCHSPMPHQDNKGIRSFANFHATFLSCLMCHDQQAGHNIKAHWVDLRTGAVQAPPAILLLINYLENNTSEIKKHPEKSHIVISNLLTRILAIVGNEPVLNYLSIQIRTAEPGSPVWRHAMAQLTSELPQHARGEYGAKLAPTSDNGSLFLQRNRKITQLAQAYLDSSDAGYKYSIRQEIHATNLKRPHRCGDCHTTSNGILNFVQLGYSPQRINSLRNSSLARQMEYIQQGRKFNLGSHMDGGGK